MKKRLSSLAPLGLAILLASCASPSAASSSPTPSAASEQSSASEPSGTPAGVGTLRPGETMPAVEVPYGMNSWTPETVPDEAKGHCPYYYGGERLFGIRASHWMSGSATQDYGSFTVMPVFGHLAYPYNITRDGYQQGSLVHIVGFKVKIYMEVSLL